MEPAVVANWHIKKIAIINGVIMANGFVHEFAALDQPRNLPTRLRSVGSFNVDEKEDISWTSAMVSDRVEDHKLNIAAICGECGMGSDGFVAVVGLEDSQPLKWVAFFDFSNPFERIAFSGGDVVCLNNLDERWTFSLKEPWRILIENSIKEK